METQKIINKKFKLNRAENTGTGRYIKLFSISQNLTKILIYLKNFKGFSITQQNLRQI